MLSFTEIYGFIIHIYIHFSNIKRFLTADFPFPITAAHAVAGLGHIFQRTRATVNAAMHIKISPDICKCQRLSPSCTGKGYKIYSVFSAFL